MSDFTFTEYLIAEAKGDVDAKDLYARAKKILKLFIKASEDENAANLSPMDLIEGLSVAKEVIKDKLNQPNLYKDDKDYKSFFRSVKKEVELAVFNYFRKAAKLGKDPMDESTVNPMSRKLVNLIIFPLIDKLEKMGPRDAKAHLKDDMSSGAKDIFGEIMTLIELLDVRMDKESPTEARQELTRYNREVKTSHRTGRNLTPQQRRDAMDRTRG